MTGRNGSFLGWVVVSTFAICGGLTVAVIVLAVGGLTGLREGVGGFAGGALLGGFFAGRASPHRSVAGPALAGALVVVLVIGFMYAVPIGRLLLALGDDPLWWGAALLGGVGMVAGLVGAILGGWSADGLEPSALRWAGLSVWITAGALFLAAVVATLLVANEEAKSAIARAWMGHRSDSDFLDEERLVMAVAATLGSTAMVGGFVTQMAAPRRYLIASSAGAFVLVGGVVAASGALVGEVRESAMPALLTGGVAAAIALVGAALAWLARKMRRTL